MLGKLTFRSWLAEHRKLFIGLMVGLLVLSAGSVGAWALDSSKSNWIAPGITVAGVDIGGRSTRDARDKVRLDVDKPVRRSVYVKFNGKQYKATPQQLDIHADVDGIVAEAKQASRSKPMPIRVFHYVFGGGVSKDLTPKVSYSQTALNDFVDHVAKEVNQPARDASVAASPDSVDPVKEQDGWEVKNGKLRDKLVTALNDPVGDRAVKAPVRTTHPKVKLAQIASKYPTYITIDRASFQLKFWRYLKLVKTYPIAVGMIGLETPAGLYHIQDKGENTAWHVPNSAWAGDLAGQTIPGGAPNNPIKARWMGFFNGAGIHGTDETGSLGHAASHGCVRMAIPDVIDLYPRVSVGTPVYIGN